MYLHKMSYIKCTPKKCATDIRKDLTRLMYILAMCKFSLAWFIAVYIMGDQMMLFEICLRAYSRAAD